MRDMGMPLFDFEPAGTGLVVILPPYGAGDILYFEARWYGKPIPLDIRGWTLLYSWEQGNTRLCGWWRKVREGEVISGPSLAISDPDAEVEVRVIHPEDYPINAYINSERITIIDVESDASPS